MGAEEAEQEEEEEDDEEEEENEVLDQSSIQCRESVALDSLPQGVSYDHESHFFQANIRDSKSGRFIFLGEFATPERAHESYLEALPKYDPEKAIAPKIS